MKRKLISKIMAVVLLISMVMVQNNTVYALSENSKAKMAYLKILSNKRAAKGILSTDWGYGSGTEFALLDINKDGVSELLYAPDGGYHLDIIAYVNGKTKNVGIGYAGIQKYYPNKKIYYSTTRHTGEDEYIYYQFTGKKMKEIARKYGCDYCNAITGKMKPSKDVGKTYAPYLYKVNGKRVSKKKYDTYVKKLLSGAKKVKPKWHKNTVANRNKYLK